MDRQTDRYADRQVEHCDRQTDWNMQAAKIKVIDIYIYTEYLDWSEGRHILN